MIAIKGMKMPKCCIDCPFLKADTSRKFFCERMMKYIYKNELESRHEDCPLVEIVTCKDCKRKKGHGCHNFRHIINEDFFCGDGKRRE